MSNHNLMKQEKYHELGSFLKQARLKLYENDSEKRHSIIDVSTKLDVSKGFIYQVESGLRKPKNSDIGRWASVYNVKHTEIWKRIGQIPFDFVATLKEEITVPTHDPLSDLTENEKQKLKPYIEFIRYTKIT